MLSSSLVGCGFWAIFSNFCSISYKSSIDLLATPLIFSCTVSNSCMVSMALCLLFRLTSLKIFLLLSLGAGNSPNLSCSSLRMSLISENISLARSSSIKSRIDPNFEGLSKFLLFIAWAEVGVLTLLLLLPRISRLT
eukprot:NODE_884_length_3465_cov_0.227867.p3 type:complete len:137 gc:universal NODE_884_length_3465_cov_0.227867:1949-2359(+)